MVDSRAGNGVLGSAETCTFDNILLLGAVIYRVAILAALRTSFVPDEIFQFTEPSHFLSSGTGVRLVQLSNMCGP
jgi:hypothetical protein